MKDQTRENLTELLRRFMDEPAARTAQEDIEAGERLLEANPAPTPTPETLAAIKSPDGGRGPAQRHRIRRLPRRRWRRRRR